MLIFIVAIGQFSAPYKGAQYSLIIHEVLVAMFFPAEVQGETLKEESQRPSS